MDTFLTWDFDTDVNEMTMGSVADPYPTMTMTPPPPTTVSTSCPVCEVVLPGGQNLHGHLSRCLVGRHAEGSPEGHLQSIQASISKLDMQTRLHLMGTLYRLSDVQNEPGETDQSILTLMYKATTVSSSSKRLMAPKTEGEPQH